MLDIKFIRENKELIKKNCKNRRSSVNIDELLELDIVRREHMKQIESLRAERNTKSKGKPSPEEIKKMREVGDTIKKLEEEQLKVDKKYTDLLYAVPNLSHPESPVGEEKDYKTVFKNGEPPVFSFPPKTHDDLMMDLNMVDFERATKISGAKFYFVKNDAVRLNQALINYGLDVLSGHGFELFETPDMVKNHILVGAGFNPRSAEESQIYEIKDNDLSLIGTAEITLLGYHANEVIDLSQGPKKYAALSHCFRTEAGAYGKSSKGLYRVHQFTKLEMFVFCKPEDSEKLHQELLAIEQEICNGLDFHYRVIDIPTGDLGGPAYKKYDIEAWMTMVGDDGKGGYGEITSTSNCTDYQARRLNIKYKKDDGSTELVHTLNGTAVVLSRFPIALIENHQQKDGSIQIPEVLKKYFGKNKISKP